MLLALALLGWAGLAGADLYRWIDPETGSIKFSSYPPPWYGDEARERRAPKVEHIPPMRSAPAAEPKAEPRAEPGAAAERKPPPGLPPAVVGAAEGRGPDKPPRPEQLLAPRR